MSINTSIAVLFLTLVLGEPARGVESSGATAERPSQPSVWAIVVNLNSDASSEDSVARWFKDKNGARWDDAHLLTIEKSSGLGEKLTPTEIDNRIHQWLTQKTIESDDIFLISIHGRVRLDDETRPRPPSGRIEGMITDDGDLWSVDALVDQIQGMRGSHPILCWVDGLTETGAKKTHSTSGMQRTPRMRFADRLAPASQSTVWVWLRAEGDVKAAQSMTQIVLKALDEKPWNLQYALQKLSQRWLQRNATFLQVGRLPTGLNLRRGETRKTSDTTPEVIVQTKHSRGIQGITMSPDGNRMFTTGGTDKCIRVWNMDDNAILRLIVDHPVNITRLALCNNAATLVSGDKKGAIRFIDHADPAKPFEVFVNAHQFEIDTLATLSDDDHLVSLDRDYHACLWSFRPTIQPSKIGERLSSLVAARHSGSVWFAGVEVTDGVGKDVEFGPVLLYSNSTKPIGRIDFKKATQRPKLTLSPDGKLLALACDKRLFVFDVADPKAPKPIPPIEFDGPIHALAFDQVNGETIAVGLDRKIVFVGSKDGKTVKSDRTFELPSPPRCLEYFDDQLAVLCKNDGQLWSKNEPVNDWKEGVLHYPSAFFLSEKAAAFGITNGDVYAWTSHQGDGLKLVELPRDLPRGGRDHTLSVTQNGKHLLDIHDDGTAFLIEFRKEDVNPKPINGSWVHGAIDPQGARIALISKKSGDEVQLLPVPSVENSPRAVTLKPKEGAPAFVRVAFSSDGKKVAALEKGLSLSIWDLNKGEVKTFPPLKKDESDRQGFEFSQDGKSLLIYSDEAVYLRDPETGESSPIFLAEDQDGFGEIHAARLHPGGEWLVVSGGSKGKIAVVRILGEVRNPHEIIQVEGCDRALRDLSFSRDGELLAAVGDDRKLHVLRVDARTKKLVSVKFPAAQNHRDAINGVVPWSVAEGKAKRLFVTASDDSTLRFWNADANGEGQQSNPLLAIFSILISEPMGLLKPEKQQIGDPIDYALYSPDGGFGHIKKSDGIRVRIHDRLVEKDQISIRSTGSSFLDDLRQGKRIAAQPLEIPRDFVIKGLRAELEGKESAKVSFSFRKRPATRIWLYHNGQPKPVSLKEGHEASESVPLAEGVNRFFAMAEPASGYSVVPRSEVVSLKYNAPTVESKLHVLALGVSEYKKGPLLRYARADAQALADHLKSTRPPKEQGKFIVLLDREVSSQSVEKAFDQLQEAMKGRPNDAVVVMLAGHADVLDGQFQLLLSDHSFDKAKPNDFLLPFRLIAERLARLEGLRRLVVIDACKAGAAAGGDDLRGLGETVGNTQPITSFIVAASGDEQAAESEKLKHGFLTYLLLKGLSATNLEPLTEGDERLRSLKNADRDDDMVVTNVELKEFVERELPNLIVAYVPETFRGPGKGNDSTVVRSRNVGSSGGSQSFPIVKLHVSAASSTIKPR